METVSKLIFKVRRKLRKKFRDVRLFRAYLGKRNRRPATMPTKAVWFDMHGNSYLRYLYLVVKWFEFEQYQVYINGNLRFLLSLGDDYSRYLIEEDKVLFAKTVPTGATAFSDEAEVPGTRWISDDYFREAPKAGGPAYHVPIGMHPHMYKYGWWNAPVDESERRRSIFFAGNFDDYFYKIFASQARFKMVGRLEMFRQLSGLSACRQPKSHDELFTGHRDGAIDIVVKNNFEIEQSELRQIIARYSFFVCCPGVCIPMSHNVYEAMSVGAIPIIHEAYASFFAPVLEHGRNAIIFNDDNLLQRVEEALALPAEQVNAMIANVKAYYQEHLTPAAIVRELTSGKYDRIYINAEKTSVARLSARNEGYDELGRLVQFG